VGDEEFNAKAPRKLAEGVDEEFNAKAPRTQRRAKKRIKRSSTQRRQECRAKVVDEEFNAKAPRTQRRAKKRMKRS
jgi:hypothetical protein